MKFVNQFEKSIIFSVSTKLTNYYVTRLPYVLLIIAILLGNCTNNNIKNELYNISKQDSLRKLKIISLEKSKYNEGELFPNAPTQRKWYSKLVIIFDSTNRVYIYQTEQLYNNDFKEGKKKLIRDFKYPNYIGLSPEHLISFDSKYFINFIKDNNDIFKLDTLNYHTSRFIQIASNKNIIENQGFYDLLNLITSKSYNNHKVFYNVRITTEEENHVIYYKNRKLKYIPEKINWSTKFINDLYKPFTKEYDSIEKQTFTIIKAIPSINKHCTEIEQIR